MLNIIQLKTKRKNKALVSINNNVLSGIFITNVVLPIEITTCEISSDLLMKFA